MLQINNEDYSFRNAAEAQAFSSWYLGSTVAQIKHEFEDDSALLEYIARRDRRLKVQLDDLLNFTLDSAITCPINKISYFKIVNAAHKNPLSSIGSTRKNSRFNYKNMDELRNRVIYFGQDKNCCYAELFHLDIQKYNYAQLTSRTDAQMSDELPRPDFHLYEFAVEIPNVLVLTGSPSFKAMGLPMSVINNEWFDINDEYAIPTASQILGTIVRKRGYNGIIYGSARTQTKYNLVLFEENTDELKFDVLSKQPFDPAGL